MKYRSENIVAGSGSIGGVVYAHHPAGLQRRAKPSRTNQRKPLQRQAQNAFSYLSAYWRESLSEAQRQAWANYAKSSPLPNVFGDRRTVPPHAMFLRCNATRLIGGFSIVADAPTAPGLNEQPLAGTYLLQFGAVIVVNYPQSGTWRTDEQAFIQISTTRWLSPGASHKARGRRVKTRLSGDPFVPPPYYQFTVNAFGQANAAAPSGSKLQVDLIISTSDGRLSAETSVKITKA